MSLAMKTRISAALPPPAKWFERRQLEPDRPGNRSARRAGNGSFIKVDRQQTSDGNEFQEQLAGAHGGIPKPR
jgi:hypothetical protein